MILNGIFQKVDRLLDLRMKVTRAHVAHDDSADRASRTAELGSRVGEYAQRGHVLIACHVELLADGLGVVLVVDAAELGQRHVEYAAGVETEDESVLADDQRDATAKGSSVAR